MLRKPDILPQTPKRGYTLLEATVVLGITGIVMAGLWGAVANVSKKSQINETVGQMMQIVQNVRSLYANSAYFSAAVMGTDITNKMIKAEAIPVALVNQTTGTTLRTAWNTPVVITAAVTAAPTPSRFEIKFQDTLANDVCISLIAATIGTARAKGLFEVKADAAAFNGAALDALGPSTIPACTNATFSFNLKG